MSKPTINYSKTFKQRRTEEEDNEISRILQREFHNVEIKVRRALLEELKDQLSADLKDMPKARTLACRRIDSQFYLVDQLIKEEGHYSNVD